MDGIRAYLSGGTLPDSPQEAAVLKKRAARFELKNGELFKAGFLKPLLKCVTPEKGKEVLEDLHSGFCASHIGGRSLAVRARRHYFWPTLEADAKELVKKCDKCQKFGIHRPATDLTAIHSPIPFAKWGMDILGPYTPAPGGKRYILVAVDYFTKWVEAEAVKNIKTSDVNSFIWKNIITRYGVPMSMVFDNGP